MHNGPHHHAHFGKANAARLAVARCGPIAREVLADDGELTVLGMTDELFHLACPRGLVAVGAGIGAGPLNVELAAAVEGGWLSLGITPDLEGRIEHGVPFITETLALDLSGATTWAPPAAPAFDAARLRAGLERLKAASKGKGPRDGLATLAISGKVSGRNVAAQMAQASVEALRPQLRRAMAGLAVDEALVRPVTLLIGLGAGLTPSGDDLLRGLLLALSVTNQAALRDALWDAIAPELNDLTVPVSAMHLSAAADGLAAASIHDLLNAVLGNAADLEDRLRIALADDPMPPWDIVGGLVIGFDAVLDP